MSDIGTDILEIVKIRDKRLRNIIKGISDEMETTKGLVSGRLQRFTFANRPLNLGYYEIAIITDGRDIGEGAGLGTGVLAIYKPTPNNWYRLDNTLVAV